MATDRPAFNKAMAGEGSGEQAGEGAHARRTAATNWKVV